MPEVRRATALVHDREQRLHLRQSRDLHAKPAGLLDDLGHAEALDRLLDLVPHAVLARVEEQERLELGAQRRRQT
jgi:hypothetical protein